LSLKQGRQAPAVVRRQGTQISLKIGWQMAVKWSVLLSGILSRLSPYIDEIIGDHQCGFRCNRSTTDHIFCIRHILKKNWEYNETVHQLFIDLKKSYDSVRREVLYSILIEFGLPMKLVRLIKMCLNETHFLIVFLFRMV
jgi:hypothetical protein